MGDEDIGEVQCRQAGQGHVRSEPQQGPTEPDCSQQFYIKLQKQQTSRQKSKQP